MKIFGKKMGNENYPSTFVMNLIQPRITISSQVFYLKIDKKIDVSLFEITHETWTSRIDTFDSSHQQILVVSSADTLTKTEHAIHPEF